MREMAGWQAGSGDYRYAFPDNNLVGLSGLAVHNARLVASLPKMNQLLAPGEHRGTLHVHAANLDPGKPSEVVLATLPQVKG